LPGFLPCFLAMYHKWVVHYQQFQTSGRDDD
jgi:hypothetical protein